MGTLFRSEPMTLCQLFMQREAAYQCLSALGEAGIAEFRDLNAEVSAFQRVFVTEVRRGDEMERQIGYIESEVTKEDIEIPESIVSPKAPTIKETLEFEEILERTENEVVEMHKHKVILQSNYDELIEIKYVLEKTNVFFLEQEDSEFGKSQDEQGGKERKDATSKIGKIGFIAGVILRQRIKSFETMLWRISKGNVFFRQADIDEPFKDPITGKRVFKSVFIVFFQGEELKTRMNKVCAGYHVKVYECPGTRPEREEMAKGIKERMEDLQTIIKQTTEHRHAVLVKVAKRLYEWRMKIKKMKAIYHIMNQLNVDVTQKCLIAECWIPERYLPEARKALAEGGKLAGSSIPSFLTPMPTNETPPTFHKTNKFTRGFQNLIDAYGMASYGEVNPAYFTIITFPFLFGVMFGDMGHGIILTIFGAWMTICEKKLMQKKSKNEIWNIFFGGRYIILVMGIYSIYIGFIYNDLFSKSINIFQSSWSVNYNNSTIWSVNNTFLTLDAGGKDFYQTPYPVGLDPVWQLANNKIMFLNTFKMKLSIVIGVLHMMFGVCVGVANYIHYKKKALILTDFVPQILFLIFVFFYMVVMMFVKWVMYSSASADKEYSSRCAPPILILFIKMVLFSAAPSPYPEECKTGYMFENQELLHRILMVLAIVCIPYLLIVKPCYLLCCKKKKVPDVEAIEDGGSKSGANHGEHSEEDEPASEIIIHQIIQTIEYVLSTISHTASYLRLWALSLAHAQLSDVLWTKIMVTGMVSSYVGCITIFFIFAVWAFFTIVILVVMEGLSAFLHTLRLHWVEFMSKFYIGLGYPFQPFSFKVIIDQSEDD